MFLFCSIIVTGRNTFVHFGHPPIGCGGHRRRAGLGRAWDLRCIRSLRPAFWASPCSFQCHIVRGVQYNTAYNTILIMQTYFGYVYIFVYMYTCVYSYMHGLISGSFLELKKNRKGSPKMASFVLSRSDFKREIIGSVRSAGCTRHFF